MTATVSWQEGDASAFDFSDGNDVTGFTERGIYIEFFYDAESVDLSEAASADHGDLRFNIHGNDPCGRLRFEETDFLALSELFVVSAFANAARDGVRVEYDGSADGVEAEIPEDGAERDAGTDDHFISIRSCEADEFFGGVRDECGRGHDEDISLFETSFCGRDGDIVILATVIEFEDHESVSECAELIGKVEVADESDGA